MRNKNDIGCQKLKDGKIQDTNFCDCQITGIYDAINSTIEKAKKYVVLMAYSFRALHKLPKIRNALIDAAERGVSVILIYNSDNHGSQAEIEKLRAVSSTINALGVPKNHAKILLTDKEAFLFTANIDGEAGLLSGFELGVFLDDTLWDEAREVINKIGRINQ